MFAVQQHGHAVHDHVLHARGVLVRLFAVRGWIPRPGESWAYALGDGRILLNIRSGTGAGKLVALDARLAGEAVGQAMISQ